uniref:Uncharacterized protein n=1 Tax=Opuntia streptacantha TaxID=393608 RepID=A0A7C9CJA0_OPUST
MTTQMNSMLGHPHASGGPPSSGPSCNEMHPKSELCHCLYQQQDVSLVVPIPLNKRCHQHPNHIALLPCYCMHSTSKHNCPILQKAHCSKTSPPSSNKNHPAMLVHPVPYTEIWAPSWES